MHILPNSLVKVKYKDKNDFIRVSLGIPTYDLSKSVDENMFMAIKDEYGHKGYLPNNSMYALYLVSRIVSDLKKKPHVKDELPSDDFIKKFIRDNSDENIQKLRHEIETALQGTNIRFAPFMIIKGKTPDQIIVRTINYHSKYFNKEMLLNATDYCDFTFIRVAE